MYNQVIVADKCQKISSSCTIKVSVVTNFLEKVDYSGFYIKTIEKKSKDITELSIIDTNYNVQPKYFGVFNVYKMKEKTSEIFKESQIIFTEKKFTGGSLMKASDIMVYSEDFNGIEYVGKEKFNG